MKEESATFTLGELCALVELPRRTVRYYIQIGLVDRPEGAGRGARYNRRHLDQLLEIRKWQKAGLSLERIRELLSAGKTPLVPPSRPRNPGSVAVCSHVFVADGIELVIDPARAGMAPETLRAFTEEVMKLHERMQTTKEEAS